MKDDSWKDFELVNARLQRRFNKSAEVIQNDSIQGVNSGIFRQIDVSVRYRMGGEEILMIVECRRWKRKIDVKGVEAFNSVKRDVRAHVGIMVSTAGFTKAAKSFADREGISLYRYRDTEAESWPNGVFAPVMLKIWELSAVEIRVKDGEKTVQRFPGNNRIHFTYKNSALDSAAMLRKTWQGLPPSDKKERTFVCKCRFVGAEEAKVSGFEIVGRSRLLKYLRLGRLHFEGLVDDAKSEAQAGGFRIVTDRPAEEICPGQDFPKYPTLGMEIQTDIVTASESDRKLLELMLTGVLEIEATAKGVVFLPVEDSAISQETLKVPRDNVANGSLN